MHLRHERMKVQNQVYHQTAFVEGVSLVDSLPRWVREQVCAFLWRDTRALYHENEAIDDWYFVQPYLQCEHCHSVEDLISKIQLFVASELFIPRKNTALRNLFCELVVDTFTIRQFNAQRLSDGLVHRTKGCPLVTCCEALTATPLLGAIHFVWNWECCVGHFPSLRGNTLHLFHTNLFFDELEMSAFLSGNASSIAELAALAELKVDSRISIIK